MSTSHFKVDSSLRWNVSVALFLLILCPLALWQFHFRKDFSAEEKQLTTADRVISFYKAFDKQNFDANQYFANEIVQYDSSINITPEQVNDLIQIDRKNNLYPRTLVQTKTMKAEVDSDGNSVATVTSTYTCYRKSIVKYVKREQKQKLVFDKSNKIISFETLEKGPETYSFSMPK